jgi:hypothetical protein
MFDLTTQSLNYKKNNMMIKVSYPGVEIDPQIPSLKLQNKKSSEKKIMSTSWD